ncbi:MAG: DUF2069 domain-containing protein [Burkholderiaceae bacterium]|nr:DUF2069 domain-containing protein [Burkholderiaceae bacterium]
MPDAFNALSNTAPTPSPAVRLARNLAVASLLALIVLCLAWELWLAPLLPGRWWLAIKALPLAFPLAGLLRYRLYTYRWTSLLVWLYVLEGLTRAPGNTAPVRWLALAEVVLSLLLFAACVAQIRLRLARSKRQQERQP